MKKILLTLLLFFFCLLFRAGEPINDLNTAKEKAQKEHKLILLKFSGSDWCVPCIKLQKQVIENEEFKIFSDKNLVMMEADFPRQKKNKPSTENQKKNAALAEQFNKDGTFPKILLLNAKGEVLTYWIGMGNLTPRELINKINPYFQK